MARSFERFAPSLASSVADLALDARTDVEGREVRSVLLNLEVIGTPVDSPLRGRCLARAIQTVLDFGGIVDALDAETLVAAFPGDAQAIAGRALLAAIEIREILADEKRLLGAGEGGAIRAVLAAGFVEFHLSDAPYSGELLGRARALAQKTEAGKVLAEQALADTCPELVEVRPAANGWVELVDARSLLPVGTPRLVGRDAQLALLEKRLTQIGSGIAQPLLVTGGAGSGKSTLAYELTVKAKHQGLVVGMAWGLPSLRSQPFGALTEILCNLLAVPKDQRVLRLRPALDALKLSSPDLAAALVVGGVDQLPQAFTAGQAVAALRSVLSAGVAGKRVVLVFDGLESMDLASVEAFRTLCAQPATRELTLGFADQAFANQQLPNLPRVELPPIGADARAWIAALLGNAPADKRLVDFLIANTGGQPARLVDWLHLLADRGWLRMRAATFTLPAEPNSLDADRLGLARIRALGPAAGRIFEATCLAGDAPSSAMLALLLPDTPPAAYQRLVASRLVRALGGRRWMPVSSRFVEAFEGRGNPILHRRLAQTLLDEARAANIQPDAALLAQHLSLGGDPARALPLWRHAAETALARRAPRDTLVALKGWADAFGATSGGPPPPEAIRARADSLARASAIALVIGDAALARTLAEEAEQVAERGAVESAEVPLALARVLRSEARPARAADALALAAARATHLPSVLALCMVEQGEAREAGGDLTGAAAAYHKALPLADAARDFARWHGEIDFRARIEARLAGLLLSQKDFAGARTLYLAALDGWRKAGWPWGESRVLANLGSLKAQANEFTEASRWFAEAVSAAGRCGDLLFQSRALLGVARAEKRAKAGSERANAERARRVAMSIGWEDGRKQAEALLTG